MLLGGIGVADGSAEDRWVEYVGAVSADAVHVAEAGGVGAGFEVEGGSGFSQVYAVDAPAAEAFALEGELVAASHQDGVGLIKIAAGFEVFDAFKFGLAAVVEAVAIVGRVGVVAADVERFGEGVGGFEGGSFPAGDGDACLECVVITAARTGGVADVGVLRERAALVDVGCGDGEARDLDGAVEEPALEEFEAAAADVAGFETDVIG